MKHATPLALLAFLALAAPVSATHYHVYLLGGQSNGNGRADAAQLTPPLSAEQTDVRLYYLNNQDNNSVLPEEQWINLAPGSGHGSTLYYATEFGPEVSFGRAMADAKPTENIAIIKYTYGGSSIGQWSATGSRYTTFVSTVQNALTALTTAGDTYVLRGMLWQQGESDTGGSAGSYETNLENLILRVRTDLNGGVAFPFVIGSLSDSQYSNITTVGSGPYQVRQAQEAVALADPTVGIAISDGFGMESDGIHFDHNGQVALGQGHATQMLLLEGPDETAPQLTTTSPVDNAPGVAVEANLVATFNEGIALLSGGMVTIRDLGPGSDVVITLPDARVSVSGANLIIDPAADLVFENPYAIRISADAVADLAMPANVFVGFSDDTTWNFTTGNSEPVVSSLNPPDNGAGVSLDANLVITFNETVQKGAGGNIVIKQNGGSTFETIPVADARISVSGSTVTINPAGTFGLGTGYHVQIADGAIEDLAGNPWAGIADTDTTTWNFTTVLPGDTIGTTGIFDENADATNQLDVEVPANALAPFKTAVLDAYNNNLGGVIDWETGVTATASSGSSSRNTLTSVDVAYGAGAGSTVRITFDRPMELYTNDINNQVTVLSRQGAWHNALLPQGTAASALEYTVTFSGADIAELGAALPSRSTYGANGVNFRATADFSGGGSGILDFTVGGTKGTGDTFLHFAAPGGETITSLTVAWVDDNGQSLTNGQRRPILDDLGLIVASPPNTLATWISNPAFGLDLADQGFGDDPDGDRIANGLEAWFGSHPGEFNGGLSGLAMDGMVTTFAHPQNESPVTDLTGFYEWSMNLIDWYAGDGVDGPPGGPTMTFSVGTVGATTTVTATASEVLEQLFVRAGVGQD